MKQRTFKMLSNTCTRLLFFQRFMCYVCVTMSKCVCVRGSVGGCMGVCVCMYVLLCNLNENIKFVAYLSCNPSV